MNNPKSMYRLLSTTASTYPDNISLDYYGTQKTYSQLMDEIKNMAGVLNQNGIGPGDKFIICLPNIPQTVVLFYALNLLGAVPCMIHPLSTAEELEFYIKETSSRYLAILDLNFHVYEQVIYSTNISKTVIAGVDDELPPALKLLYYMKRGRKTPKINVTDSIITWKGSISVTKSPKPHEFNPRDPALVLFSGGTTGVPKGVLLSNCNMNALAFQVLDQINPKPGEDSILCILPFFHGFGLGVCLHPVLLGGGRCILVPRFSGDEFATIVRKKRPTYIAGVPTLFQAVINNPKLQKTNLDFLKCAFCGGDTTPPALVSGFNQFVRSRGGEAQLREGYGLTECVTACSVMPAHEHVKGSVGQAFAGTQIKIVDMKTLEQKPVGNDGEICINGPTVMLGYLNKEAETAAALRVHMDGKLWLHTGDWGCVDAKGYLYFKQRVKRIIKRSGYSVYPFQVEEIINSHPMVQESCVIGIPDDYSMEKIKAFVVYKGSVDSQEETAKQLIDYVSRKLVKWALPSEIEFCSQLPMTRLGKVSPVALEELEKSRRQSDINPTVIP